MDQARFRRTGYLRLILHLFQQGIWVSPKIMLLSSRIFSKNLDLEKFLQLHVDRCKCW